MGTRLYSALVVLPALLAVLYTFGGGLQSVSLSQLSLPEVLGSTQRLLQPQAAHSPEASSADGDTCHLAGYVGDNCNCTYKSVDELNSGHVNPVLSQLVKTAFFRYFKVNIYCDCPLWPEDGMCSMQACSVCECEEAEVPQPWLVQEECSGGSCDRNKCAAEHDSVVNRTVEPHLKAQLLNAKGWRGLNNPWMAEGENDEEYLYINLLVNPERYTGYKGEHAHRIWNAIYSQSCFEGITSPDLLPHTTCPEKRVFYRLISGMHASISAHLSNEWLLDEEAGRWGPNLEEFRARLGTPEVRPRVQNLYFAYLFTLRAVLKVAPLLRDFEYTTGFEREDRQTQELMLQLLGDADLSAACPVPFDEGRLWKGEEGPALMTQLQAGFRNITRVMDCVGCEKCKLWGKLQTLGVATALKVLFVDEDCSGEAPPPGQRLTDLRLERNEVIALVNLLERFSKSLEIYRKLSAGLQQEQGISHSLSAAESVA